MTDRTSLGDRMKQYERVPKISLTGRMPMIIRADGRAFHTYTKRTFKEWQSGPWSLHMRDCMTAAAEALMAEISGAKMAYVQSDEISVLVTDYDTVNTQAWFDKAVQKVASVSASIATAAFNEHVSGFMFPSRPAHFDARCFVLPVSEVTNYFIWRQQDATRNSILMLAQAHFSHKKMHGKNTSELQDMLMLQKEVNWNNCEVWQKRGWSVLRNIREIADGDLKVRRSFIEPDWETPIFTKDREYIERHVRLEEA